MKIKIIIASTIALVSFSNACIDNPECKADLKKCKQEYTKFLNKTFKCVENANSHTDLKKCKIEEVKCEEKEQAARE